MPANPLPPLLDEALRIVKGGELVGIKIEVIERLLALGYIKHKYDGGWMTSSKGNLYLKQHPKPN
jgi:hypothetical protein